MIKFMHVQKGFDCFVKNQDSIHFFKSEIEMLDFAKKIVKEKGYKIKNGLGDIISSKYSRDSFYSISDGTIKPINQYVIKKLSE